MIPVPPNSPQPRTQLGSAQLGPNQKRVLDLLVEVGPAHSRGIARTLGLNHGNVKTIIDRLVDRGLVVVSTEAHPDPRVVRQYEVAP